MNAAGKEPVLPETGCDILVETRNMVEIKTKRSQHVFQPNPDRRESLMMRPVSDWRGTQPSTGEGGAEGRDY